MNEQCGDRREFMRNEGFVLADDFGHQFMDDASRLTLDQLNDGVGDYSYLDASPSAIALYLLTSQACGKIKGLADPEHKARFHGSYDIKSEERDRPYNKFNFEFGFGDNEFTWHFASGLAANVVNEFENQGYITSQQYASMALGDWADIIGSGWFSDLVHDMALTSNGRYGSFGSYRESYKSNALRNHLHQVGGFPNEPLFEVVSVYEEQTDKTYLTARTRAEFRHTLRKSMQQEGSPGCPVARKAGTLSEELVRTDHHARRLIRTGRIMLSEEVEGRFRFTQDYTPIDRGLDALAGLLDEYDANYGTPDWSPGTGITGHQYRSKTGLLVNEGNIPFINGRAIGSVLVNSDVS